METLKYHYKQLGVVWRGGKEEMMLKQRLSEKRQRLLELAANREKRAVPKDSDDEFGYFYIFIGNKLKEARIDANITQQDLAAALGLARTSIVNIESGFQRLPIHKLFVLAALLDVPVKSLLPDDLEGF